MKLRLDPWAAEYQTAFQAEEPPDPEVEGVDPSVEVEAGAWRPVDPMAPAEPRSVLFLDGSRRVEARVLLENEGGRFAFGALGSYGVGAVACEAGSARFCDAFEIDRICALSGGENHADLPMPPSGSHRLGGLRYRVVSTAERDAEAVVRRLQAEMRDAEGRLAARLVSQAPGAFVICDGPRPLLGAEPNLLGYLKTIHELRVGSDLLDVVRRLEQGQRSPIYLVQSGTQRHQRFEWFVRLRDPRPWLYSLAGVVRLQAFAGPEPASRLASAVAAADWSCSVLPHFATRQHQDPRAPQQLLPVRALEAELRRRMGSPEMVRRRITEFLSREGGEA